MVFMLSSNYEMYLFVCFIIIIINLLHLGVRSILTCQAFGPSLGDSVV